MENKYKYFKNKDDLYRYIIVNELDRFKRYIELIDKNYVVIARARSYILYERRDTIK
jgi:hypothetical protein